MMREAPSPNQMVAVSAAGQATEAVAELLRFVREGAQHRRPPFGDVEVVELLADALKLALEVEGAEIGNALVHPDDTECRNQLLGAVTRFLEGWV